MHFYDVMAQYVGHDIIVDNAKVSAPMQRNHPIGYMQMPPLQRYCYRHDSRRKRKSIKQQQPRPPNSNTSSLSMCAPSIDSNMQIKERGNDRLENLLMLPTKYFHDAGDGTNMSKENRKQDVGPKAPTRKQTYYDVVETTDATMVISTPTVRQNRKFFSYGDGKDHNNVLLPIANSPIIARVA